MTRRVTVATELRAYLKHTGMTNAQFAEHAGIKTVVVNGLCIGRRLSPHMALRLGEYTSFPAEYWMALQTAQDLAQARDEVRNLKEYRSTQYGT